MKYALPLLFFLAILSPTNLSADTGSPAAIITPDPEISKELLREEKLEEANFFRYKDNYILGGKPNTKVQFSLKFPIILHENLFLAYTQQMFWKLSAQSKPFQDINFNPELFYEWQRPHRLIRAFALGIEHRSNGKAGLESRSLDRLFVETGAEIGWKGYQLRWDTRVFWIYDIDWQTNNEIRQYTGFWYTRFAVDGLLEQLIPTKTELYLQFNPGGESGTKSRYGSIESGLKVRARIFGSLPYLMVQYYYGYMESLLDYNVPTHSYRIGFLL